MIVWLVFYLYLFWVLYIAIMGVYRAHLDHRLSGIPKVLSYPLVIVGLATDAICQFTIASILFADLPVKKEYLVTTRLQRYIAEGGGWRYKVATYICNNLLDIFDPRGKHC